MTPFEAYKLYLGITLHFKSDKYDFFKYNGSVRAQQSAFEVRADKYQFHKLSKQENPALLLASNLIDGNLSWIGNLFDDQHMAIYKQALKRSQSLSYIMKNELQQFDSFDEALNVKDGEYPKLLKYYQKKLVSPETLVIVNKSLKIFDYWSDSISDKIVWPKLRRSIDKYSGFVKYDHTKYKRLLVDIY